MGLGDFKITLAVCFNFVVCSQLFWTSHGTILRQVTGEIQPHPSIVCEGTAAKCYCHKASKTPYKPYHVKITLSIPKDTESSSPAPVIVFFHGHAGQYAPSTGDYLPYARKANERGYIFLEYDVEQDGKTVYVPDAVEVQFLKEILDWAAKINEQPETPAEGKLDLKKLYLAGHSRGAKLSALHFASDPDRFKALYLVDPVECPCFAPCTSDCYPSAISLLSSIQKPIGVSAADIVGCCNPNSQVQCGWTCQAACYVATGNATCTGQGAQDFLSVGGPRSQGYSQIAGHMQFADVQNYAVRVLANSLCLYSSKKTNEVPTKLSNFLLIGVSSRDPPLVCQKQTETETSYFSYWYLWQKFQNMMCALMQEVCETAADHMLDWFDSHPKNYFGTQI